MAEFTPPAAACWNSSITVQQLGDHSWTLGVLTCMRGAFNGEFAASACWTSPVRDGYGSVHCREATDLHSGIELSPLSANCRISHDKFW